MKKSKKLVPLAGMIVVLSALPFGSALAAELCGAVTGYCLGSCREVNCPPQPCKYTSIAVSPEQIVAITPANPEIDFMLEADFGKQVCAEGQMTGTGTFVVTSVTKK